jgi:hypothetical protein
LRGKDAFDGLEQDRADGAIFTRKVQAGHPQRGTGRTFFPVSHIRNGTPVIRVAGGLIECI